MKRIVQVVLAASFFLALPVSADPMKDAAATELAFIKRVFQTGYAPYQWKKQEFNWDLDTQYANSLNQLAQKSDLSAQGYRNLIGDFLRSTHDYHVGFQFYSTESATLPFQVRGVQGRYFVGWIDRDKLPVSSFPVQVGDEVLTWGGQPIAKVMADLVQETAAGVPTTDERIAELVLTNRRASRGEEVPQGFIDISFRHNLPLGQTEVMNRQLYWNYHPETIPWRSNPDQVMKTSAFSPEVHSSSIFHPEMAWGMWSAWKGDQTTGSSANPNPYAIAGRTSYVPTLGTVIWKTADKDEFNAYIYRNAQGKLIGYLRIPIYMGQDKDFAVVKDLVKKFEAETDALVIDETNNPGGSVFYVYALMSILSPTPIVVPDEVFTVWPQMLDDAQTTAAQLKTAKTDADVKKILGDTGGYPATYELGQSMIGFSRFMLEQWKEGKKLTDKAPIFGVNEINPDPEVHYTKPIVVLTNNLDFSGADFFPAILQDNKRVKIFGERTAGAGGYILDVQFPSSLGLKQFSFTGSLAIRLNNKPIENLGVTPDIPYTYTVKDMTNNYSDYKAAINKAVMDQITQ